MRQSVPALVRRAQTNRIASMLREGGSSGGGTQGGIEGVGLYGTPGSLPTDPGPIDPPILTSGGGPGPYSSGGDLWTRMDPNMGQINPSLTINAGEYRNANMGGPQGSVYAIDPNTGRPIYNVTGSPRPGFFDSRTGKFVSTLGSAALNTFVPGLGFVSKAIFDALRNRANARNTGTDLSGNQRPTGGRMAGVTPQGVGPMFGFAPQQGGGLSRWDPATGRVTTTPSLNPLYSTDGGRTFNTVAGAPTDIRWDRNSGTGNFQASETTKNFIAGGGYAGAPNQSGPDSANRFYSNRPGYRRHVVNGVITNEPIEPTVGPAATPVGPSAAQLYQQALGAVPMSGGYNASYAKRLNDWIAARRPRPLPIAPPLAIQPAGGG